MTLLKRPIPKTAGQVGGFLINFGEIQMWNPAVLDDEPATDQDTFDMGGAHSEKKVPRKVLVRNRSGWTVIQNDEVSFSTGFQTAELETKNL